MLGSTISEELKELFNSVLGVADYEVISDESSFSYSTVCNIINRRTRVNDNNKIVVAKLIKHANRKILDAQNYYARAEYKLKDLSKPYTSMEYIPGINSK